jgi:hypothetical protein
MPKEKIRATEHSLVHRTGMFFLAAVATTASCARQNAKVSAFSPTAESDVPPVVTEDATQDPVRVVKWLLDHPERVDAMLDTEFLRLLTRAQGDDSTGIDFAAQLRGIATAVPRDCELHFERDEGYSAIAIPPPMNDQSKEQVALIEKAAEGLREGEEVLVYCRQATVREEVGSTGELLFGVNVFQGHIRAWIQAP